LARAADQFRQSDVVKWGAVAAGAALLALICANVSALVPEGTFAALHNSRALNQQSAALNAEVAALNGSKSNLLSLSAAQQELQSTDTQLSGRLDRVEKAALSDRGRIGAVEAALPRLVNTLPINDSDSSLVTGSIGNSTPGFKAVESEPPALPAPAPTITTPSPPPTLQSDLAAAPVTAPAANPAAAPVPGPQWSAIISLPAFTTPAPAAPTADVASITPAPTAADHNAPFPMTPRASGMRAPTLPPVALAPVAPPPAVHPDVKAIGVAIGSPMQPSAALAGWQQIAEQVGVKLVGMSPLLADDPAGSPGKVLVAGPIASIAAATRLCADIDRSGLSCMPMPYVGSELTPAATP
jgi:hypothetical protein